MLRKLILFLVIAALLIPFSAFTSRAQGEQVTLTFQHFFTDNTQGPGLVVQKTLDKWLKEHPNVKVDMQV